MKKVIKNFAKRILHNKGYEIQPASLSTEYLRKEAQQRSKSIINQIAPDLVILNGTFKGVKYPSLNITEDAVVPKIVGSYESQLHGILNEIINTPYSDIIDVGCAEGYYAVGLAYKMPGTTIHGFDINKKDLEFCKQFADANNVKNIDLHEFCSPQTLIDFDFRSKGLVFCDCEGYELDLFTPQVIKALTLKNVDVLVELHDVLQPGITSELLLRFKDSYDIKIFNNKVDLSRDWKGLENLSKEDRKYSLNEHRGGLYKNVFMEWGFFSIKTP